MKDENHAEFAESERPDAPKGELAVAAIAVPDDLGDPRFIESVEDSPQVKRPERCAARADSKRCEKEEVGEIEPVRNNPCPWMPESDLEGLRRRTPRRRSAQSAQ